MKPPYEITSKILHLIASISEKIGEVNAAHLNRPPTELRKRNRIKTIQSSLEIEGNTLTVEQITDLLDNKRILAPEKDILEVKNLYLYLDDFSEIDMDAQTIFIDWFIAPLNNLSENFFKFKIATYRGRLYLGKIDRSKIDFIHLDFFEAYNIYKNISKSEELALDYNGRLINNRCSQFFKKSNFSYFVFFSVEIFKNSSNIIIDQSNNFNTQSISFICFSRRRYSRNLSCRIRECISHFITRKKSNIEFINVIFQSTINFTNSTHTEITY